MPTEITLRRRAAADAEIITHHRRAMFEDMGIDAPEGMDRMDLKFLPWVRERLADGRYIGVLACAPSGEVVGGAGMIIVDWIPSFLGEDRRAYVFNVYTRPDQRGQGIARRTMTALIEECRARGVRLVGLHASEQGRALYVSLGFTPTNEMRLDLGG